MALLGASLVSRDALKVSYTEMKSREMKKSAEIRRLFIEKKVNL